MRRIAEISLLLAYVATNTFPRWVHGIDGDLFCKWQAVSYMCLCLAAMAKRQISAWWVWAALLTANNMYDEVFGYPLKASWVEWAFAASVTLGLVLYLIWKSKCQQSSTGQSS